MAHIPYGYEIENGRIIIDDVKAKKLETAIKLYLAGESLKNTAEKSGINICHLSMVHMLTNEKYVGDGYYPAIIDKELLEAVKEERQRRAEKLGRVKLKNAIESKETPKSFKIKEPENYYEDPFEQAAYMYSLIESESEKK